MSANLTRDQPSKRSKCSQSKHFGSNCHSSLVETSVTFFPALIYETSCWKSWEMPFPRPLKHAKKIFLGEYAQDSLEVRAFGTCFTMPSSEHLTRKITLHSWEATVRTLARPTFRVLICLQMVRLCSLFYKDNEPQVWSHNCTELVGYTLNSRTHKLYSTNPCFYSPRGFPTRR